MYTVGSYLILNECLLNKVHKAVKMSQWLKCLPHKPEDLILRTKVGRRKPTLKSYPLTFMTVLSSHTHTPQALIMFRCVYTKFLALCLVN